MEYLKIYLLILLPVIAAIFMVYINYHIKKKLKDLEDKRKEEYISRESEKELADYLKETQEGDLVENNSDSDPDG